MVIDRCCWKRWWTAAVFAGPATVLPTGCMLDKPQDAAAWTGSIKLTVKPSKTSTSIRWCRTSVSSYAVISYGKQILIKHSSLEWSVEPAVAQHQLKRSCELLESRKEA